MTAMDDFLRALSGQESGGESDPYGTSNREGSGAYGKYQFMPQYWPEFAQQAGLPANTPMTPENQERVARARVTMLYNQYGNWADVAAVWYSGRPLTGMSESTASASQYGGPSIRQYANEVVGRMSGGSAPVNGRASTMASWATAPITQGFGPTDEPLDAGYAGYDHFNKGYDYGIPAGTPIDSNISGTVISAGDAGDGWGISVKIRDADGYTHNFGHLSSANVEAGQQVGAGAVIGASGNTGKSTGDHLSYDVWDSDGNFVDPSPWVSGGGQMPQLPFSDADYQTKMARYLYLDTILAGHDPLLNPVDNYDMLLQEWSQLGAEINSYDTAMASGGTDINDQIARGRYEWDTDPRRIDAENTANAWARQQAINQQATAGTQNDLAEQRATADAASAETQAYTSSSHFTQPMGFRVGATDLPTEEELFQKNIDRAAKNLPEVAPIPYAPALGAFGAPRAPGTGTAPTQSFGSMPTQSDFESALNPPRTMPGGTVITNSGNGGRIGAGSFASESNVSAFGKRFTSPMDLVRNALADTQRSTTPGATRMPTPAPVATGTPTPYSTQRPNLLADSRRFVGSLFNRRY